MRVGLRPLLRRRLAPEVVQLLLGEAALEEGPRVDARRRVALVEDLVAGPAVVAGPGRSG